MYLKQITNEIFVASESNLYQTKRVARFNCLFEFYICMHILADPTLMQHLMCGIM